MSEVLIGVDPGKTGAMAMRVGTEILIFDFENPLGVMKLRELRDQGFEMHAVIEKVNSMPKQGIVSAFNFGMNFGLWQGIMKTLMIPYDLIVPLKWQNEMFDFQPIKRVGIKPAQWSAMRKKFSLERAKNLYPEKMGELARVKDHNRADALLIMGYCERKYGKDKALENEFDFL